MGRYTTVQSYSDQYGKAATVSYADATGAKEGGEGGRGVKINKVDNVMGSTAGAGSGEFHVYRAARRREMARLDAIYKQAEVDEAEAEFLEKRLRNQQEAEQRTSKLAEKRKRKKLKQQMMKQERKQEDESHQAESEHKKELGDGDAQDQTEGSEPSAAAGTRDISGSEEQKAQTKKPKLEHVAEALQNVDG